MWRSIMGEPNSSNQDFIAAHKHASHHRPEIHQRDSRGCFHCLETFNPLQSNVGSMQAVAPKCGIDAVIGSASGFPITKHFPKQMHEYWF
jgi:hypothetical protein